ncbi:GNAT family N-acetyltransferase [Longirhabdus pacifica]|uniref:GNAT family N-acetyltransferase n=1 Tax=Longirhabdus pacifica TaxID=2305227 RepID=UPI0010091CAE|nr:GNAT family N-acetyltransferase [Longirhabdus pacifica]
MFVKVDDLKSWEVQQLITSHLDGMAAQSPPESIHALDLHSLRSKEITFWTVWEKDDLLGCGALKQIDEKHGELKSMRTAAAHLRKGVARKVLEHIIEEAKKRGYERLSLETGSMDGFEPARNLYATYGFQYCEPFSTYTLDPNSVFMTKQI